jgi:tetratricopeptide (TPR) repeat protein
LGPPLVLVLGFDNRTTDPVLDGTLDLVLESALTRSPTIYPLAGASARALVTELAPDAGGNDLAIGVTVSERTHQRVVIVRGSVAQEASGFGVTLTLVEGSSGGSVGAPSARADGLERVVSSVARLGCAVRAALGDAPCEPGTEERSGMSASLETDKEYATGRGAYISGKLSEAVPHLQRAVDLDPTFALSRFRLGLALYSMELHSEGQAQIQRAFAERGNVSDREGLYMEAQGDLVLDEYKAAIPAYEKILERWPLDTRVPADLAIAYHENGDAERAVEIGKRAAAEHPKNVITRSNLPGYYLAAGDIEHAESEARAILAEFPNPPPYLHSYVGIGRALAGDRAAAAASYRQFETADPSEAAIAEGDYFMFDGRYKDAIALLEASIASDDARKAPEDARAKWALLGEAWLEQGDLGRASDAATHAAGSVETTTLLCAGRIFSAAGHPDRAAEVARKIATHPGQRAPLFSRIVDMDILVARGASTDAVVRALGDIGSGPGSWLGHADLGAAYLARGAFDDAIRELEVCASHEGGGAKAFFDRPTLRYVQRARGLLVRAKEGARPEK